MPSPRRALSRDDARCLIADLCFVPAATAVGLELEFLTFTGPGRRARPDIDRLAAIANTAALPSGSRLTLEPGGQVEVSTAPRADLDAAIEAATADIAALIQRLAEQNIDAVAIGYDRWRAPSRLLDTPRYRAMEAHFDRSGDAGRRMMCNTAALQVNVHLGVDDRRWRAAHAVAPALIAAFANSPGAGWKSRRLANWFALDDRSAPVLQPGDPATAWADYALAAPTFVCGDQAGGCRPLPGAPPLGVWVDGGHPDAGFPDEDDVRLHLTTLFPPVRPRGWLEVRYLDALPSPWWEVATLVLTALLDEAVVDDAFAAAEGTEDLWLTAARDGLDHEPLARAADRCFALALERRDDARVAEYVDRYVSRRVPAWA